MGLSFEELNELTMRDIVSIAEIYTDRSEGKAHKRKANEADKIAFWGINPNKKTGIND